MFYLILCSIAYVNYMNRCWGNWEWYYLQSFIVQYKRSSKETKLTSNWNLQIVWTLNRPLALSRSMSLVDVTVHHLQTFICNVQLYFCNILRFWNSIARSVSNFIWISIIFALHLYIHQATVSFVTDTANSNKCNNFRSNVSVYLHIIMKESMVRCFFFKYLYDNWCFDFSN